MSLTASRESIWECTPISKNTIETSYMQINQPFDSEALRATFDSTVSLDSQQIENKTENNLDTRFNFELPNIERQLPTKFSNVKSQVLQKWVCSIVSLDDSEEEFNAVIKDVTNPNMEDEYVTISYEEISTFDLASLKIGAIFYWTIGYRLNGETKSKYSEINFQRLVSPKPNSLNSNSGLEELQALFADVD